jgi:hypothetical protein
MTCEEVAKRYGLNASTIRNWAAKNNVGRVIGAGGVAAFVWTEADLARFKARPRAGRPRKDTR